MKSDFSSFNAPPTLIPDNRRGRKKGNDPFVITENHKRTRKDKTEKIAKRAKKKVRQTELSFFNDDKAFSYRVNNR